MVDDTEHFYDNLAMFNKAVISKKYPKELIRNISFVSKEKPADKTTVMFIKWVVAEGSSFLAQFGYAGIDNTDKTELMKQLE